MNKRFQYGVLTWGLSLFALLGLGDVYADESRLSRGFAVSAPVQYVFGRQLEQRLFSDWEITSSWFTDNYPAGDGTLEDLTVSGYRVDVDRTILRRHGTNTGIALGVGWQRYLNDATGLNSNDGPRLSLVGRLHITDALRLYGRTAWVPQFGDEELGEFEAGFYYDVRPSISVRAGVRWFNDDDVDNPSIFSQRRYMLGAGVSW